MHVDSLFSPSASDDDDSSRKASSNNESVSHDSRTSLTRSSSSASDTLASARLMSSSVGLAGRLSSASGLPLRGGRATAAALPAGARFMVIVGEGESRRDRLGASQQLMTTTVALGERQISQLPEWRVSSPGGKGNEARRDNSNHSLRGQFGGLAGDGGSVGAGGLSKRRRRGHSTTERGKKEMIMYRTALPGRRRDEWRGQRAGINQDNNSRPTDGRTKRAATGWPLLKANRIPDRAIHQTLLSTVLRERGEPEEKPQCKK